MRLLRAVIRNFQRHRRLVLRFAHVTTLVGPTDAGKSAVLRALRWASLNDTIGTDFVRDGARRASVSLIVRERKRKWIVRRTKGSGTNLYQINGVNYKAFGSQPPDDVRALLRLDTLNFQDQHDGPFWLGETAGEVSRRLNAVVDLSVMDEALARAAAGVRSANERLDVVTAQWKELELDLAEMRKQRKRIKDFKRLKKLQLRAGGTRLKLKTLQILLTEIETRRDEAKAPPDFSGVESLWKRRRTLLREMNQLDQLVQVLDEQRTIIEQTQKIERRFHKQIKGQTCPTCGQIIKA